MACNCNLIFVFADNIELSRQTKSEGKLRAILKMRLAHALSTFRRNKTYVAYDSGVLNLFDRSFNHVVLVSHSYV